MTTSNRLGITELAASQVDRSVTVNEAIAILEAVAGGNTQANSVGDNSPPGSPAEGDIYVVGTSGTGGFSGHDAEIAIFYNAAWIFVTPLKGFKAYAQDDDTAYIFDGSTWNVDPAGGGSVSAAGVSYSNGTSGLSATDVQAAIDEVVVKITNAVAGVAKRGRVRAATTANITIATALNNGDAIDGVTLATGDLVLVKNQSSAAENGIYIVGVSPSRSTEFDTYDEHPGSVIAVEEGTTNADTLWLCTSNVGGTLGSTSIVFSQINIASLPGTVLKSDTSANLTAGYTATAYNAGTKTTGTFTPDPANGGLQRYVNGGAHTLAPPSTGSGDSLAMTIQMTNNGSAGAMTTSGFTKKTGDALTTTNGDDFMLNITVINGFSHLNVVALQ